MSTATALVAQATASIIQGNKDDIQAKGERVGRRNEEIRANAEESLEVSEDMNALQAEAADEVAKAEDAGFWDKLVRARRRHLNNAEELNVQAVELSGEVEHLDREDKTLRDANEDTFDAMEVRLEGVTKAIGYIEKMSQARPTIQI